MERQDLLSTGNVREDLIGSATTVEDIVHALAQRGCTDLTSSIDLGACSNFPRAGGGFCDVYRGALYDSQGTKIAIKSLRVYDGSEAEGDKERRKVLKRAARELYHWSKLQHCNVLPLMGLAIFRGQLSMISEWMENGSLTSYLRLKPDANRNRLCMDVCEGLCYIHMKGMVHGDLKAANVMVSTQGTAMIADFGNTQLKDLTLKFSNTTKSGLSVRWAAPELLLEDSGPQVSKEADVYACGMTMLEALTGKVPYEGTSDNRILILVAIEKKLPPRPNTDDVSDDLWDLLSSCWVRVPSKRPEIAIVKNRLQILFWPPSDAGESGTALDTSAVGYAGHVRNTGGEQDSAICVRVFGADEDTSEGDNYREQPAEITRVAQLEESSLGPSGVAAPPASVSRVLRVAPPPSELVFRDFPMPEESDDSDEDSGRLSQVPKENSAHAVGIISGGEAHPVQRPATKRTAPNTDTSANAGLGSNSGGELVGRPLLVSHKSSTWGSQSWGIRPKAEEVYQMLDQFFPNHDLDQAIIDAPSWGASPVPTEAHSTATSIPPAPLMSPRVKRYKKSIRVVAAERKRMLERKAAKLQRPTVGEPTHTSDSTVNGGTAALWASISQSTKMWGKRVEEVTPGATFDTGVSPNVPKTIPEEPERQRPTIKWVKGQLIGRGTYGRVYLAMNLATGEMIAVKQVQLPKTDSDRHDSRQMSVVDALKSESDILCGLDHPHIVQYLGIEETTDTISIFLEYVPGGSVGGVLRKFGKLEDVVVRSFSHQIIDGLAYLHKSGILHRDLKADNILVDPSGICKISDFGISTRNEHAYNNFEGTAMQGSVFWMAPEMLHNNKQGYSAKIDIWSVGCIVLEMQAGRRPWAEEDMISVLLKVGNLRQAPPVPDYVHLTPLADDFRKKCFAIDPAERPTAAELLTHPWLQVPPGWVFGGFNKQP